ncbi:hypothetical protein Fmac_027354 [Flemingia macrophylla]|uniref:At1g68980-like TPR repeats domain-containing protein n=1 Tax=Flemingia macrophylla TaxID=520843 RepID=A0ABD1LHG4_9FABA
MVLSFTKYIPISNPLFRKVYSLHRNFQGHVCFERFNPFLQTFSTSDHCERLSWERSTQDILLGKLKFALRNHQVHEAWETFQDFRTLYGYPEVHDLNQLIVQLSYSSNQVWMRKTCDLVLQIVEEKSGLLHDDTLTKLALSLARLKMPSPSTVILRLMLDKGSVPSMHLLSLIVFHIVKTEVGTNLASNYLFQVCDFHNCLNDRQAHHAVTFKADTLVFNLVLDACVRFKLSLKGLCLVKLMSLSGTRADAHSIVIISQILEMNGLRDELKELKDHVDGVSAAYVRHYRQFYDTLLSLHFKFIDIDAAAKLVLDMTSSHNCNVKKNGKHLQNPCFISIGSPNLRTALKIHLEPELLYKDSVLRPLGLQWTRIHICYSCRLTREGMQREAKALLKQMKKVGLDEGLSDDVIDKQNLCEETLDSLGKADLAIALAQILKDEDQTVFPLVYNFNSSIFFFYKARMIEDALKAYRRMVAMKVQPTIKTFSFLMCGYFSLGRYREITIL